MMHPGRRKAGRTFVGPAREILLERLAKTNLSIKEAAAFAERDRETIRILFKRLKAEKLIYVADWKTDGHGPYVPLYAIGNERDEPMPPRQSNSVRSRLYRARRGAIPRPKDPILRALMGTR